MILSWIHSCLLSFISDSHNCKLMCTVVIITAYIRIGRCRESGRWQADKAVQRVVQHDTPIITTLLWEVIARHVAVTCVAMRADFSAVIGLVTHVPSITARNYPEQTRMYPCCRAKERAKLSILYSEFSHLKTKLKLLFRQQLQNLLIADYFPNPAPPFRGWC